MNNLKKTILIAIGYAFLFSSVSFSGTAQTKSKHRQAAKVTPVVCQENNEDCFIQAAETCRKANLTLTDSINLLGIFITTGTSYREIRGGHNGNCTIYFRTIKTDVKFTEEFIRKMKERGATQEQIEQGELKVNKEADEAEGKDGVCIFKTKKLVALLRKWKGGDFSSNDWKGGNCRGTMFDQTNWRGEQ